MICPFRGVERAVIGHRPPGSRPGGLDPALLWSLWRKLTVCCGDPGPSHPHNKEESLHCVTPDPKITRHGGWYQGFQGRTGQSCCAMEIVTRWQNDELRQGEARIPRFSVGWAPSPESIT